MFSVRMPTMVWRDDRGCCRRSSFGDRRRGVLRERRYNGYLRWNLIVKEVVQLQVKEPLPLMTLDVGLIGVVA